MKPEKPSSSLHLDPVNQCLWQGSRKLSLTPKAFLVLRSLMDRPGQLVTKEELLNAAWPEVYVGDAALKVCIRRLRQTLGDETQVPRFIETIPWRGYRFIGTVSSKSPSEKTQQPVTQTRKPVSLKGQEPRAKNNRQRDKSPRQRTKSAVLTVGTKGHPRVSEAHAHGSPPLVGRELLLAHLQSLLSLVRAGQQQTVFLTGEPGIGKTALIDAFLSQMSGEGNIWVVSGQCIEHYGTGEPYLPLLDALEQLCRRPENEKLVTSLRQYAPMWLAQMPSLISPIEQKRLQRTLQGTTPERMLREFAEVISHLTEEKPLLLILEDLHWSDSATLDLLAFLTRRQLHPYLFCIGTYRPDFVLTTDHPLSRLTRELSTHGRCHTIALSFLDEAAVQTYITNRFPGSSFLPALARAIYLRSDGNPLFMVNAVEYLLSQGLLRREDGRWQLLAQEADLLTMVPTNVQQLIEMQIERLSPEEQHLLEVASVVGLEFSAAAIAAAMTAAIPRIEEQATKLARQFHFLRSLRTSTWPDGTVAQQYTFIHSLYQQVFYQRIPAGTRVHLHARIGQQVEHAYGVQAPQIAVELAMHFERGHDFRRAVQYHRHAADTARQRCAYREAIEHLTVSLELLKTVPDSPERIQDEISLCCALGIALTATEGYASVAVERMFNRAHVLWQQAESIAPPFPILHGLWGFANVRAELPTAITFGQQLSKVASSTQDPFHVSLANNALGSSFFWQGNIVAAQQHYEQSLALHDLCATNSPDSVDNPSVLAFSSLSVINSYLGNLEQAQTYADKALALAQEHSHYHSLAMARCHIAALYQVSHNFSVTQDIAGAGITLSAEKGFPYCLACSTIQYGWARAMQTGGREGIEQIHAGVAAYRATGAVLWQAHFLALLAEAQLAAGQTIECLATLTEGLSLAQTRGMLLPEADLYRIKGDLLLQSALHISHAEAETCFLRSIDITRRQQARTLELRATLHLTRLWHQQGKSDRARRTLIPVYEWFSQRPETAEVQEARNLLSEMHSRSG